MLTLDETPNDHKRWLLELIKTNRSLIKTLEASTIIEHEDRRDLLTSLRSEIRDYMKELLDLERWRRREGYEPDQPYEPRSTNNKMKGETNG